MVARSATIIALCAIMAYLLEISKVRASALGLNFICISSSIILVVYFCKKTNKIIKIKAMFKILAKNNIYLLKLFLILTFFKPKKGYVVLLIITFGKSQLNSIFYFVWDKRLDLSVKNDLFFYVRLYSFRLVLLPSSQVLLVFFNFIFN